jgi:hypothetical protein
MSSAAFTPGRPWKARSGGYSIAIYERVEEQTVAMGYGKTLPEAQANARLIAAAPELLEALQAEQEWCERDAAGAIDPEWDYDTMVAAKRRAAIAKATGSAA